MSVAEYFGKEERKEAVGKKLHLLFEERLTFQTHMEVGESTEIEEAPGVPECVKINYKSYIIVGKEEVHKKKDGSVWIADSRDSRACWEA